jgi:hypothetical protein
VGRSTIKGKGEADFLTRKLGGKDISDWVKLGAHCVKTEKIRRNAGQYFAVVSLLQLDTVQNAHTVVEEIRLPVCQVRQNGSRSPRRQNVAWPRMVVHQWNNR